MWRAVRTSGLFNQLVSAVEFMQGGESLTPADFPLSRTFIWNGKARNSMQCAGIRTQQTTIDTHQVRRHTASCDCDVTMPVTKYRAKVFYDNIKEQFIGVVPALHCCKIRVSKHDQDWHMTCSHIRGVCAMHTTVCVNSQAVIMTSSAVIVSTLRTWRDRFCNKIRSNCGK